MPEKSGVFLLHDDHNLQALEPAQFAKETEFQQLLSRFPELLVGDQIDPQSPRRWVLVKREQPISTGGDGASQWSLDHLFVDQDGIPTLVEVKRQSDNRIRREVVGQMLDYAANCLSFWSVETLQYALEDTCKEAGKSVETVLRDLIGPETSIDEFWERVKTNLRTKNIRLLFVADMIPLELRRIVEFLNEQMNPAEVLAVELRQFEGKGLRTIVPTVYGQTQETARKRVSTVRRWDEASLFEKLKSTVGSKEVKIAEQIYEWMRKEGKRELLFGSGRENGSVYPAFKVGGVSLNPVYLTSDGKLWFQFGSLENKPIFGSIDKRRELMLKVDAVDGVNFTDADLTKVRSLPLRVIAADPKGPAKIIAALTWMEEQIAESR
jgi:hypothetical protein